MYNALCKHVSHTAYSKDSTEHTSVTILSFYVNFVAPWMGTTYIQVHAVSESPDPYCACHLNNMKYVIL